MCVSPITLPNVSYRPTHRPIDDMPLPEFVDKHSSTARLHQNTTLQYTSVPCGHCIDCKRKRQLQFVQRAQVSALDHHVVYWTLSIQPSMMSEIHFDYLDNNGKPSSFTFRYADVRDIQNMFKRIRKDNALGRPFKYMFVTEYGGKTHRPHFHGTLFLDILSSEYIAQGVVDPNVTLSIERMVLDVFKKYYARNVSRSTKKPEYRPICDFNARPYKGRLPYDVQYIHNSQSRLYGDDSQKNVMFYITKYAMKDDSFQRTLWKELNFVYHHRTSEDYSVLSRYSDLQQSKILRPDGSINFSFYWNLIRPKVITSKLLGIYTEVHYNKIRNDIESSIVQCQPNFTFSDPSSGVLSTLSAYYRHKVLTSDDVDRLVATFPETDFDNSYDNYRYSQIKYSTFENENSAIMSRIRHGKRIQHQIESRDNDPYYFNSSLLDGIEDIVYDDEFDDLVVYPVFLPNENFDNELPDYTPDPEKIPDRLKYLLKNSPFSHFMPKETSIIKSFYQPNLF